MWHEHQKLQKQLLLPWNFTYATSARAVTADSLVQHLGRRARYLPERRADGVLFACALSTNETLPGAAPQGRFSRLGGVQTGRSSPAPVRRAKRSLAQRFENDSAAHESEHGTYLRAAIPFPNSKPSKEPPASAKVRARARACSPRGFLTLTQMPITKLF